MAPGAGPGRAPGLAPAGSGMSTGGDTGIGSARCGAAIKVEPAPRPERLLCGLLHTSWFQSTTLPRSSSEALSFITIAGPNGSQPNSSSRIHCTFTGRGLTARASSAASSATSSAPLWP